MEFYKSTAGCGYNEYAIVTPTGNKDEYLCVWTNERSSFPVHKENEIVNGLEYIYLEPFDAKEDNPIFQSTAFTFFKQVNTFQSEKAELVEMVKLLVDRLEENGFEKFSAVKRAKELIKKATDESK